MFATLEVAKAFVVFSDSTALEVVQLMNCTFIVKLALSLFLLDDRSLLAPWFYWWSDYVRREGPKVSYTCVIDLWSFTLILFIAHAYIIIIFIHCMVIYYYYYYISSSYWIMYMYVCAWLLLVYTLYMYVSASLRFMPRLYIVYVSLSL